jgi:lycopene cyclase domain-containing protein
LNPHYTYLLILAASLAGPLALSFDKKVAFYRQWKYLVPAMLLPALVYITWDIWFTERGVWSFNEDYIIGIKYGGLPIEEILFFLVVPYCCVFIYECIRVYFPRLQQSSPKDAGIFVVAIIALIIAVLFRQNDYTGSTATYLGVAFFLFLIFRKNFPYFNSELFLISYAVILLPFLVVNGFLTAMPVVLYNDVENLGIRLYTIPVEDVFYGMLLVFLNILLFEYFRYRK